jgi:hypothetical protein
VALVINFRYHLVSLLGVLIALAVGIVLGGGILHEPIAGGLADQVSALRSEKDELRAEVSAGEAAQTYAGRAMHLLQPAAVAGMLTDRRVALIALDPGAESLADDVAEALEQAGAKVDGHLQVNEAWLDAKDSELTAVAGEVENITAPAPAQMGDREILAAALVQAATARAASNEAGHDGNTQGAGATAGPDGNGEGAEGHNTSEPQDGSSAPPDGSGAPPDGDQSQDSDDPAAATGLFNVLASARLVSGDAATQGAEAIVLVTGPGPEAVTDEEKDRARDRSAKLKVVVEMAVAAGHKVVLAGPGSAPQDLVGLVRADAGLAQDLSTLDGPYSSALGISAVWGVAEELRGRHAAYGFADGSEAKALPPRTPNPSPTPDKGKSGGEAE